MLASSPTSPSTKLMVCGLDSGKRSKRVFARGAVAFRVRARISQIISSSMSESELLLLVSLPIACPFCFLAGGGLEWFGI